MHLLDSNILIYSYLDEFKYLRDLLIRDNVFVSEISRVEIMGFHKLSHDEETYFRAVFELIPIIVPDQEIYNIAIAIRRKHNLKLGDSLIAATAFENKLSIYTRNISDFKGIEGISCIDPILPRSE